MSPLLARLWISSSLSILSLASVCGVAGSAASRVCVLCPVLLALRAESWLSTAAVVVTILSLFLLAEGVVGHQVAAASL